MSTNQLITINWIIIHMKLFSYNNQKYKKSWARFNKKLNPWRTALTNQERLKRLLPDGSTEDFVVSKALYLNLNFSFLKRISLHLNQVANQCALEAGWTPFQTLYFQNKFLGYSRETNPGSLKRHTDVPTTKPKSGQEKYRLII